MCVYFSRAYFCLRFIHGCIRIRRIVFVLSHVQDHTRELRRLGIYGQQRFCCLGRGLSRILNCWELVSCFVTHCHRIAELMLDTCENTKQWITVNLLRSSAPTGVCFFTWKWRYRQSWWSIKLLPRQKCQPHIHKGAGAQTRRRRIGGTRDQAVNYRTFASSCLEVWLINLCKLLRFSFLWSK